jgi:hypothetical protein
MTDLLDRILIQTSENEATIADIASLLRQLAELWETGAIVEGSED